MILKFRLFQFLSFFQTKIYRHKRIFALGTTMKTNKKREGCTRCYIDIADRQEKGNDGQSCSGDLDPKGG